MKKNGPLADTYGPSNTDVPGFDLWFPNAGRLAERLIAADFKSAVCADTTHRGFKSHTVRFPVRARGCFGRPEGSTSIPTGVRLPAAPIHWHINLSKNYTTQM